MGDRYQSVSKFYDVLSSVYSLGQVSRCRMAFVGEILEGVSEGCAGVKVCFAGVGHGEEAIELAKMGVMVTVVDLSASMLRVFEKKLGECSDEVRDRVVVIHGDIRNVEGEYDWVVANFFLNVFSEDEMVEVLDDLLGKCCLDDEGRCGYLVIGDFYFDSDGRWWVRMLQWLNWNVALMVFRVFVSNAKHPIYDYEGYLIRRGWGMEGFKRFGLLGVEFYQSGKFGRLED